MNKDCINPLILDAGDLLFKKNVIDPGVTLDVAKVNAEIIIDSFNEMGCDAFSLGSKDFSGGLDFVLSQYKKSNFPFLSCNIANKTGELIFDDVKVPKENLLPNKSGLGAPLGCLDSARYGISWGAIGAAMDCYDTALRYSKERIQFGKPIGGFQLQQKKLAEMITEITKAQLLAWRLGMIKNEDRATSAQISIAKRKNVEMAIKIARESRQILGGMGITGDYSIMRHMMNLESVITYEGTHDIHLLITGMDITGINAFK